MLIKGGWMMIPIALCSLVAITIIIERFFYFRRIRGVSRAEEVIGFIRQGKTEEALHIADEREGSKDPLPVMKVLVAGITHPFEPGGAMEAAAIGALSDMKRGLTALDTIITLSPLLGLLGTIIGMIGSFNIMASAVTANTRGNRGVRRPYLHGRGITVAVVT